MRRPSLLGYQSLSGLYICLFLSLNKCFWITKSAFTLTQSQLLSVLFVSSFGWFWLVLVGPGWFWLVLVSFK